MKKILKEHADERHKMHVSRNTPGYRPLSANHQAVGLSAEAAWVKEFGGEVDTELRPQGDKGYDFDFHGWRVDVKGARNAHRLLVKKGKTKNVDIFVLAEYNDETGEAKLVGWCETGHVLSKEPRDTGFGIVNHEVPARELHPMWVLRKMHRDGDKALFTMSEDENGRTIYHRD